MYETYAEQYARRNLKLRSYMSAGMAGAVMIFSLFFAPVFAKQSSPEDFLALFGTNNASSVTNPETNTVTSETKKVKEVTQAPVTLSSTNFRENTVKIAERELQKRPREYDRTVLTYTQGMREEWCADFVSYVYLQAGQPLKSPINGTWRIPAVKTLRQYFESQGRFRAAGSYVPKPGDVALYGTRHTNLVVAVADGKMTTIGGNENDTISKVTISYSRGSDGLTGFGVSAE